MILDRIDAIRKDYPANLMAKYFDNSWYQELSPEDRQGLERVIASGLENPDSIMGAYAMAARDYERFQPYLDKMICDYHGIRGELQQVSDWTIGTQLDLTEIDPSLAATSMRVRVGRNLVGYPLPGGMDRETRVALERRMVSAFDGLNKDPQFAGTYVSLTPGSKYEISKETYLQLVSEHKMFKDMAGDPYLSVAGISGDWPWGRGMYQSTDGQFIIWVGEEDHLRIMVMKHGSVLNGIFEHLQRALRFLQEQDISFANSPRYGYLTSCPTNLGTGMRASLHIALPGLTNNGSDLSQLKTLAAELGLSVRGAGGEHTASGEGGVVDISPKARLQVREGEICQQLYNGVKALWSKEKTL